MKYQYKCEKCGNTEEREFPLGKPKRVYCHCRKLMSRVIENPKIVFKGSGWASGDRV